MGWGNPIVYTCGGDERVVRTDGLLSVFGGKQAILAIVIAS